MKKAKLIILIFFLIPFCRAQDKLATIFSNKALNTASYSYYAIDAASGQVLTESPQMSLVPASVMKIVTTAAALEILGPEFKFKSVLAYSGNLNAQTGTLKGDIIIHGGCDPAFYSKYFKEHYKGTFEEWVKAIRESGIKRIKGNIIVDLTAMNTPTVPGTWLWEDIGNYYGTGVSAMTYSDNSYDIHLSSPETEGRITKVNYTEPAIKGLTLENNVVSSSKDSDNTVIYGAPASYQQVATGTIPKGRADFVIRAATPDPAFTAAGAFRGVLLRSGIMIEGKVIKQTKFKPVESIKIAEKLSPQLKDLIIPLNQESINLFAEHLLREIGRAKKNDPSLEASTEAVTEFWTSKGIFLDGFFATDGSGLSHSNNICPRTLVEMLNYINKSKYKDYFYSSLPIAGETGTLKNAFHGTPLESNVRAKTGTIKRVKSLAGYLTSQAGKKIIFALIINNFSGSVNGVRNIMEQFVSELYNGM